MPPTKKKIVNNTYYFNVRRLAIVGSYQLNNISHVNKKITGSLKMYSIYLLKMNIDT